MAVRERYSYAKADKQQKLKQKEAEARTELRVARTDEQQLAKLDAEGRIATKERAKLQARIDRNGSK